MISSYSFNRRKIVLGVLFFMTCVFISILFIIKPNAFVRNFLMKEYLIQILGIITLIYNLTMLIWFIVLLFQKKEGFVVTDAYLIDNSKFVSLGKIFLNDVSEIRRIKNIVYK